MVEVVLDRKRKHNVEELPVRSDARMWKDIKVKHLNNDYYGRISGGDGVKPSITVSNPQRHSKFGHTSGSDLLAISEGVCACFHAKLIHFE